MRLNIAGNRNQIIFNPDFANTNLALLRGAHQGDTASFGNLCETVIFGPGGEPVYQPNESLALTDIEAATRIYALTAAEILRVD